MMMMMNNQNKSQFFASQFFMLSWVRSCALVHQLMVRSSALGRVFRRFYLDLAELWEFVVCTIVWPLTCQPYIGSATALPDSTSLRIVPLHKYSAMSWKSKSCFFGTFTHFCLIQSTAKNGVKDKDTFINYSYSIENEILKMYSVSCYTYFLRHSG